MKRDRAEESKSDKRELATNSLIGNGIKASHHPRLSPPATHHPPPTFPPEEKSREKKIFARIALKKSVNALASPPRRCCCCRLQGLTRGLRGARVQGCRGLMLRMLWLIGWRS